MNPDIPTTHFVVDLLAIVVAVGLTVRGRWRLGVFFAAYIVCFIVKEVLVIFWPERFFFQRCWLIVQSILDILKLGIALEVGWRTFGAFPGAAAAAQKTGVLILGLTAVAVASLPLANPQSTVFETAVTSFHPRVNDGTIWLIAAILAIAKWYRVPVRRFHAALLTSFALYLVFYTWVLRIFVGVDLEGIRHYANAVDAIGFLLLTCWWVHITWRSENGTDRTYVNTLRTLERGAY